MGPGVIDAFYSGYATIEPDDYEYLCKLDLDLRLPPRYFEILIERMVANPLIATCSGKSYIEEHAVCVTRGDPSHAHLPERSGLTAPASERRCCAVSRKSLSRAYRRSNCADRVRRRSPS